MEIPEIRCKVGSKMVVGEPEHRLHTWREAGAEALASLANNASIYFSPAIRSPRQL